MNRVRPAALAHRGRITAAAYYFPRGLFLESEARRRMLSLYEPGAAVFNLPRGWLLVLARPHPVSCDAAPGVPLTAHTTGAGRVLLSAPLTTRELEVLAPPPGAAVLLRAGEGAIEPLNENRREDPAQWLDPGPLNLLETASLGKAPEPVVMAVETPVFDPRQKFAGVPAASPDAAKALQALQGRAAETDAEPMGPLGEAIAAMLARLILALTFPLRLLGVVVEGFGEAGGAAEGTTGRDRPAGGSSRRKPNPVLQDLLARLLSMTRLSLLIGRAQAKYVARMLEMFERGDLENALRYAIPLGAGEGGEALALGMPSPRDDLRLSLGGGGAGSSLLISGLYERLQELYRNTFSRLEGEGRIDEAAFVLADLLHDSEAAVAFLERHNRLQLAAELAEARELEPALVIRQWFLAGNAERAVLIARRTGAFLSAINRLQASHPELADALRRAWAENLAASGDYPGAIEALWPLERERPRALEWLDRSIELGGVTAARMLARKLTLVPGVFDEVSGRVLSLLEDETPEETPARAAFAQALQAGPTSPEARTLARAATRALARDLSRSYVAGGPRLVRQVASFAQDGALTADMPVLEKVPTVPRFRGRAECLRIEVEEGDTGTIPITDAALLPDGRCLLALGEVGVRLLSRSGKTAAHFEQPAHALVVGDHGHRAIAVAGRGDLCRLARLDLATFRDESWCEAQLGPFARTYDGSVWMASTRQDGLVVIDALGERFSALWRTRELANRITALSRSQKACTLLVLTWAKYPSHHSPQPPPTWERWWYELPDPTLRYRWELPEPNEGEAVLLRTVDPGGNVVNVWRIPGDMSNAFAGALELGLSGDTRRIRLDGVAPEGLLSLVAGGGWSVVAYRTLRGVECRLYEQIEHPRDSVLAERVRFLLHGTQSVNTRLEPEHLTLCDNRGRLLVFSMEQGRLIKNLRVS